MSQFSGGNFKGAQFAGTKIKGGPEGGPQKEPTGGLGSKAKSSFLAGKKQKLALGGLPEAESQKGSEGQVITG